MEICRRIIAFVTSIMQRKNMKIINEDHLGAVDVFVSRFGKKIEQMYPELRDKEFHVISDTTYNNLGIDRDSPMSCDTKDEGNFIIFIEDLCNNDKPYGQEGVLLALLAHELGHFIAKYRDKDSGDEKEEMFADRVAFELGLGEDMKKALDIMKDLHIKRQTDLFCPNNLVANWENRQKALNHVFSA